MSQGAPRIGPALQRERKSRKLTLEQLSEQSGVSKSMLSQIERGATNPTFAVVWSLTQALSLSFSDLIGNGAATADTDLIEITSREHTPEIRTSDDLCRLRILSPTHLAGQTEWYDVVMQPGGKLNSNPHPPGTFESFTSLAGVFQITCGANTTSLREGETARYPVDTSHSICNVGDQAARGFLIVLYA